MKKYEKADEIYKKRYQLALKYDFQSLCHEYNITASVLRKILIDRYNFNFTRFRRIVLACCILSQYKEKTSDEIRISLQISNQTFYRLLREIGIKIGHGGDRKSMSWKEKELGSEDTKKRIHPDLRCESV